MSRGKVLIAAPVHDVLTEGLKQVGYELVFAEKINQQLAFDLIRDCLGVVTSTRLLLNKELLDAAPALQWIGRMGSGMEVIDVPYAEGRGISCFSSPEGNSNAVAEHAVGMLLSVTKRLAWSWDEVRAGKWLRDENRGTELEGKTIGIIGFGHVGKAFARKLSSFDMRILTYDKYDESPALPYTEICRTLDPVYEHADILSFHVPLRDDTFYYFNEDFLDRMNKSFILINTSRGDVVDTEVVHRGIVSGKIKGACLDVLEGEPLNNMQEEQKKVLAELLKMPEVLVTPHIAGYSHEALFKMSQVLLGKIVING